MQNDDLILKENKLETEMTSHTCCMDWFGEELISEIVIEILRKVVVKIRMTAKFYFLRLKIILSFIYTKESYKKLHFNGGRKKSLLS